MDALAIARGWGAEVARWARRLPPPTLRVQKSLASWFSAQIPLEGEFDLQDQMAQVLGLAGLLQLPRLEQQAAAALRGARASSLPRLETSAVDAFLTARGESARLESAAAPVPAAQVAACEQFLAGYNQARRRRLGAYYTPREVVGYVARSVALLLARADERGARQGEPSAKRASLFVDPSAGCGAFLLELASTIDIAHGDRIQGIELQPAAALILDHLLRQLRPETPAPFRVECRDALQRPLGLGDAEASDRRRSLVVVGNPPYSNFGRPPMTPWLRAQLQRYKRGLAERKHNLHDLCLQFIRWSDCHVQQAGRGVLALIVNNAMLRGLTHRVMREALLETYEDLWILELFGGADAAEPHDQNVFDVRQGIAILIGQRGGPGAGLRAARLTGDRGAKLRFLRERDLSSTAWQSLQPAPPMFWVSPDRSALPSAPQSRLEDRYRSWMPLDRIFAAWISGVQTKCDALFIDCDRDALAARIRKFLAAPGAAPQWLLKRADRCSFSSDRIRRCQVAPLDRRWMYYDPQLLGRSRWSVMRHVAAGSEAAVFMRQSTGLGAWDQVWTVSELATDRVLHSRRGAPFVAPLRLQADDGALNLTGEAWRLAGQAPGSRPPSADLWHYLYAVLHSPLFRARFDLQLRAGFPRVPPCLDPSGFAALAQLGQQLIRAHHSSPATLEPLADDLSSRESSHTLRWAGQGSGRIERLRPREASGHRIDLAVNATQSLTPLDAAAWNWHVGGVAVIKHWLNARRGAELDDALLLQLRHLARVAVQTRDLAERVDAAVRGAGILD